MEYHSFVSSMVIIKNIYVSIPVK